MTGYSIVVLSARPPRTYGSGRVCVAEGCRTILSRYNPASVCSLHEDVLADGPVPEDFRRCRSCGLVKPATPEHFHRTNKNKSGLYSVCRECRNRAKARDYVRVPDPGDKRCPRCGRTRPLNRQWWYWNASHASWSSHCRVCVQDENRERARRKAGARLEARA